MYIHIETDHTELYHPEKSKHTSVIESHIDSTCYSSTSHSLKPEEIAEEILILTEASEKLIARATDLKIFALDEQLLGMSKVKAIKHLRQETGLGLKEASIRVTSLRQVEGIEEAPVHMNGVEI